MSDWTSGYITEVGHNYGYDIELNPLRLRLALLNVGLVPPTVNASNELGYGQGLSINLHAAGSCIRWWGTDFNPAHAAFSRQLAADAELDLSLCDESFLEYGSRDDLPLFDFIALHGVWSWISDDNRREVVDLIKRRLKPGGVLYLSYITQPGWASMVPLRKLLLEYADTMCPKGLGIAGRIDAALDFAEQLFATHPAYTQQYPFALEILRAMKAEKRFDLAHEYFNQDWQPALFAEIADQLSVAKLDFGCSAYYPDHLVRLRLTDEQMAFLDAITDVMLRETVRDFMVNQQFRKDYWIKGAQSLTAEERAEALRRERVVLVSERVGLPLRVSVDGIEIELKKSLYGPLLDYLADNRPKSIADIEAELISGGVRFQDLCESIMLLIAAGVLQPAQLDDDLIFRARSGSQRLNSTLLKRSRVSANIDHLSSPVTGGGIPVSRLDQLFLLAKEGGGSPEAWAIEVWRSLSAQGQKLMRDGQPIDSDEQNMNELIRLARVFSATRLPVLKRLQVVV